MDTMSTKEMPNFPLCEMHCAADSYKKKLKHIVDIGEAASVRSQKTKKHLDFLNDSGISKLLKVTLCTHHLLHVK